MRISYVSNEDFRNGVQDHSPENLNFDLCRNCFNDTDDGDREAFMVTGGMPRELIEENNNDDEEWIDVSGGEEHPPYEDTDYTCAMCRRPLTMDDN